MPDHLVWGASIRLRMVFGHRSQYLNSIRRLVSDVCEEYLEPCDTNSHVLIVINELLENIIKYSSDDHGTFELDLVMREDQPMVRVFTQNAAAPTHLAEAKRVLGIVTGASDPPRIYDEMIASSGEQVGSGLGLMRIRAETGLKLTFEIHSDVLKLEASGRVMPKRSQP